MGERETVPKLKLPSGRKTIQIQTTELTDDEKAKRNRLRRKERRLFQKESKEASFLDLKAEGGKREQVDPKNVKCRQISSRICKANV